MNEWKRIPIGLIVIAVVMFFVALGTVIFWLAKFVGKPFPETMPVSPAIYNAFAAPDIIMSLLLCGGAVGLLKFRKWGLVFALVALGMWLFDSLFILGITKLTQINILGPSIFFVLFAVGYLLIKRELFD
ncbi:hypothetical protein ACFLT2_06780 [Acidobacteriota bacterium]